MPENLEKYIEIIIGKGYASSFANAINLIVLERMMDDKKIGDVTAFRFELKDNRRTEATLSEIETDNITEKTVRSYSTPKDAPHLEEPTAPLKTPVTADAENKTTRLKRTAPEIVEKNRSEENGEALFGPMKKPAYPGTMEEYLRDPANKTKFNPPTE